MQRRRSRSIGLLSVLALALAGCSGETGPGAAAGAAYVAPRTPWGDPDLTGMWPIDKLNGTPVQRPESFGDRRYLTEEEFAARVERLRRAQRTLRRRDCEQ